MSRVSITNLSYLSKHARFDSEFFQEEYLDLDQIIGMGEVISKISDTVDLQSNGAFKVIFEILNDNEDKNVPYIRSGNVGDFFINKENLHLISSTAHSKLTKTHTKEEDVLMARKGKIGGATIITSDDINYNSNDNVVNIRLKDNTYSPWYFVAFWNCKYGLKQIERYATGNVQPWLSMKQVRMLKTVKLPIDEQHMIEQLVKKALKKQKLSKDLYDKATHLLDKALGLNGTQFENEKSYTASFSEIVTNNRSDADFYQTKYRQLAIHLDKLNTAYLGSICMFNKGYEVGSALYTEEGPLFIRVSNLSKEGIVEGGSDKYISSVTYNQFKSHQPQVGDILLTKDGTIGTCYVVDEKVEGIISSGILNLTLNDLDIPKEYLALVINSKICRMQATRDCSGALILHWKPEQIRKLRIPILSKSLMNELSDLVIESKKAQKKSKELLEQAIEEVESLIEKAAERL